MRKRGVILFAWLLSGTALALPPSAPTSQRSPASRPSIGAPEPWVLPAALPPEPEAAQGSATIELLLDTQTRFSGQGDTTYYASASKIASSQGLDDVALQINWDPSLETVTIHRYRILRDGHAIDLLGDGSKLSVVQRETRMESATLDGELTATLQPEDVRVGDIIDLAYSRTRHDPATAGRSEVIAGPKDGVTYGRYRSRILWPASKTMRWRVLPGIVQPKLIKSDAGSELVTDVSNTTSARPPQGAPERYRLVNAVEVTEFPDWATVSRTFAPLYARAEALGTDSPVKAEAARIAASTADPKTRTERALQLVQNEVRYLFLGMDDGGYVPASADLTWSRRFGDCKGKTVLLVALLREMGIEARAVLVNTQEGDYVAARLPVMGAFDHAVVEARIGGRSYWLDGTRLGDTQLSRLQIPNYRVGLPIVVAGTGLEPLVPQPLDQPSELVSLDLDASKGIDVPAPAIGEMRFRGETATDMRVDYAGLSKTDLDEALRKKWRTAYDFVTPTQVATRDDPATGDFLLTMIGTAKTNWSTQAGTRWYEIDRSRLGWMFDDVRDGQLNQDAPFAVDYPDWYASRETIKLPYDGKDFLFQGDPVDRSIGGLYAFHRTFAIDHGVMTMNADTHALAAELPAASAATVRAQLAELADASVFVRVPDDYVATEDDLAAIKGDKAASAQAYLHRGAVRFDRGETDASLADENAALALDDHLAGAHAVRALILANRGDVQADTAADRAIALDPKQWIAWRAKGLIALLPGRYTDAVKAFTAELALNPKDGRALAGRGSAQLGLRHFAEALADLDAALELDPTLKIRIAHAEALANLGRGDEALAEADRAVDAQPNDNDVRLGRSAIRMRFSHKDGALEDLAVVIARDPKPAYYTARARLWPGDDGANRAADIESALKLDPHWLLALEMRASDEIEAGRFPAAEADIAAVAKIKPDARDLNELRMQMAMKRGQTREALGFADAGVAAHPNEAGPLNERCWLKATMNISADTALADCEAAVKLAPTVAAYLDSRAFAKLRAGTLNDALADYDAALKLAPDQASSLFGRGIVHARLGEHHQAHDDLARAREISPGIDKRFAGYGVPIPVDATTP